MPKEIDLPRLQLADIIHDGDHIVWGSGTGEPVQLIKKFLEQRHRIGRTSVFLGGISYTDTLQPEHADVVTFSGFGAMARLRGFCRARLARFNASGVAKSPCSGLRGRSTIGVDSA